MNDHNRLVEQAGVYQVGYQASQIGCLFRQIFQHDKGIDGEIEICQTLNAPSVIVAVQVKSRTEFRKTKNSDITITVTEQNLQYWRSYGRPVILIAYSQKESDLYWTRVDNSTSQTIKISLKKKFNSNSIDEIKEILVQYYKDIACQVNLKDFSTVLSEIGDTVNAVIVPIKDKLSEAYKLSSLSYSEHNFYKAARIFISLSEIYEKSFSFRYNSIICLMMAGKINEALQYAYNYLSFAPDSFESYALLGHCLGALGKDEESEKYLLKGLSLAPQSSLIWYFLGLLHHWQGHNERAIEELELASKYDIERKFIFPIHFKLAQICTFYGQYKQSIEYYNSCLEYNPFHYESLLNRGLIQEHILRLWDALESYEKAVNIGHYDYLAIYKFASLLKDLWYNQRAIQKYNLLLSDEKFVLENKKTARQVYSDLAVIYCRYNEFAKATYFFDISYFEKKQESLKETDTSMIANIDFSFETTCIIHVELTQNSAKIISISSNDSASKYFQKMRELIKDYPDDLIPLLREDKPVSLPMSMECFNYLNSLQRNNFR